MKKKLIKGSRKRRRVEKTGTQPLELLGKRALEEDMIPRFQCIFTKNALFITIPSLLRKMFFGIKLVKLVQEQKPKEHFNFQ